MALASSPERCGMKPGPRMLRDRDEDKGRAEAAICEASDDSEATKSDCTCVRCDASVFSAVDSTRKNSVSCARGTTSSCAPSHSL